MIGRGKVFDFDSIEPVQGEVYIWSKEKAEMIEKAIEWVKVFIVIAGGFKLMFLVYHGWYWFLVKAFATYAPDFYMLLVYGQLT
jgi:hypothetical protein